ncbi:MAG: CaiB/BaiF CoA-transferase family protein [Pseudomonadota bacterium]
MKSGRGPLDGIRIIEVAGIGPVPFCAMMLADHGAEVIRVDRPGKPPMPNDPMMRGRRSIVVDIKTQEGAAIIRKLAATADGLVEGFRPGAMEAFGLGPDTLCAANPRLVYGRMTGWGQTGLYADRAGHDINYIALSGVLSTMGPPEGPPTIPVNYLGDYAGGAMMLAFGILAGLLKAKATGEGDVIDCAMTDGSALIGTITWHLQQIGEHQGPSGSNLLDGGAPFYGVYRCADGELISLGSLEPQFYMRLLNVLDLTDDPLFKNQYNQTLWSEQRETLEALFATHPSAHWDKLLFEADLCYAPVLSPTDAAKHPHNKARETFRIVDGFLQPAPAPRIASHERSAENAGPTEVGAHTNEVLDMLGYDDRSIEALRAGGIVA